MSFKPPYYAVIFTSKRSHTDAENYTRLSNKMLLLAKKQSGFLGVESAREEIGITVSYWKDLKSIQKWKNHIEHIKAQKLGRNSFYKSYSVRIAKVEKQYFFDKNQLNE